MTESASALIGLLRNFMTLRATAGVRGLYLGFEEYVLRHGKLFTGRVVDSGEYVFPASTARECFTNALHAAASNPDLTYCEGFAYNGLLPVHHAWLVDPDGNVHDPTWDGIDGRDSEHDAYIGVPFRTKYLVATVFEKGDTSLLDWTGRGVPLDGPPTAEMLADVPGEAIPAELCGPVAEIAAALAGAAS